MTAAQKEIILKRLKALIPEEENTSLFEQLIDDAEGAALAYTRRAAIIDGMLRGVGDLAIVEYNRRGTEGESSRNAGGESYSFNEEAAYKSLVNYRLALAAKPVKKKEEADDTQTENQG